MEVYIVNYFENNVIADSKVFNNRLNAIEFVKKDRSRVTKEMLKKHTCEYDSMDDSIFTIKVPDLDEVYEWIISAPIAIDFGKNPFNKTLLKKFAKMTDDNYHGEVREEIAKKVGLDSLTKTMTLLNKVIMESDSSRIGDISLYDIRNKLTDLMLDIIGILKGDVISNSVARCL